MLTDRNKSLSWKEISLPKKSCENRSDKQKRYGKGIVCLFIGDYKSLINVLYQSKKKFVYFNSFKIIVSAKQGIYLQGILFLVF